MGTTGGNSVIVYGESETYKTTNAGFFAQWVYERYGKVTRLISGDGGGWAPIQPHINAGIIVPWQLSGLENPIETLNKLSKGFWPEPDQAAAGKLKWPAQPVIPADVGAYIVEGLTSNGDIIMKQLCRKGPKLGQDASYVYTEGTETMYGANQTYYGFVQNRLYDLVIAFNQLPLEKVLWTAHESKGEDDNGKAILGPSIAGRKAVSKCPAWFGDCIHFEKYIRDKVKAEDTANAQIQRSIMGTKAYFQSHPDPLTGLVYPAKPRVPSEQIPALLEKWPGGYFDLRLDSGLNEFLEFEQELQERQTTSLIGWRKAIDEQRAKQAA